MISRFIIVNANGITAIQTSAPAAQALRPIAGAFTFALFAAGITGIGLLAVPVLAGSGACALGEALAGPPASTRSRALFWSAVINGVVAVAANGDHHADGDAPRCDGAASCCPGRHGQWGGCVP
jgi:Mn2+/Fe2+ NRAMP family transporter